MTKRMGGGVAHLARTAAIAGVTAGLMAAVATAPAQASVSELWAGASSTTIIDHRTTPATSVVRLNYDAFVTTDNAAFQIQAGGKLIYTCYGIDHTGRRLTLFSTEHTGSSRYPLVPYGTGMYVNARFERPKGTLFDVNKKGKDTIWCEASYNDKSYPFSRFYAYTNTVTGYF